MKTGERQRFHLYSDIETVRAPANAAAITTAADADVKDFVVGATPSAAKLTSLTFAVATDPAPEPGSGFEITAAPWVWTIDDDFDPIYGDLGKVDTTGDDEANNYVDTDDSNTCDDEDGGEAKDKDVANGTLCNATQEIETSVSFPLGLGYGCDAVKKTYTLTCTWNARGQGSRVVATPPTGLDADNVDDFVDCKVEEN